MASRYAYSFATADRTWHGSTLDEIETLHSDQDPAGDVAIVGTDRLGTASIALRDLLESLGASRADANGVVDGLVTGLLEVADDMAYERLSEHRSDEH